MGIAAKFLINYDSLKKTYLLLLLWMAIAPIAVVWDMPMSIFGTLLFDCIVLKTDGFESATAKVTPQKLKAVAVIGFCSA